jgi:hypothetical protein
MYLEINVHSAPIQKAKQTLRAYTRPTYKKSKVEPNLDSR